MVRVFFWHTSLSMVISSCIHVAINGLTSFLMLNSMSSYIYVYTHIYINIYTHTTSSSFIHLSMDICFHVLTIVNSAATEHKDACIFLNYSFVWLYSPGVRLLDHVVILCLVFWGTSSLFFIIAALSCQSVGMLSPYPL